MQLVCKGPSPVVQKLIQALMVYYGMLFSVNLLTSSMYISVLTCGFQNVVSIQHEQFELYLMWICSFAT